MWYGWLNRMGPCNREWIANNGSDWAGGRIDLDCDDPEDPDYDRYGQEYSAPIMKDECWEQVFEWLMTKRWPTLPTSAQIWKEYKEETGNEIKWWRYEPES